MKYPFASMGHSIDQNNDTEEVILELGKMNRYLDMIVTDRRLKGNLMENLNREKYIITKQTHTSFIDIDEITYLERASIMKYIMEDLEHTKQAQEKAKNMTAWD